MLQSVTRPLGNVNSQDTECGRTIRLNEEDSVCQGYSVEGILFRIIGTFFIMKSQQLETD